MLRLSELYPSIQGEGPNAGTPTSFVRFAGCNLRCAGWPCDTQHAIQPHIFQREQQLVTPEELADNVPDFPRNICLTGGEPFIQHKEDLERLVDQLLVRSHSVECFTNGTIIYPDWFLNKVSIVMDWKLPGSGEDPFNLNRQVNAAKLKPNDYIKFVIKDWDDFIAAKQIWEEWHSKTHAIWSAGVVWSELELADLVQWILAYKLPWQLNVQIHNYIWDREKRGI